jgi:hypothetical protein
MHVGVGLVVVKDHHIGVIGELILGELARGT